MTTKNELAQTLKRTDELAHDLGWLRPHETLVLFEADRQAGEPWSVRVRAPHPETGNPRHVSGVLSWLPDSGRTIGWTKREAQETLQTINGVLSYVKKS